MDGTHFDTGLPFGIIDTNFMQATRSADGTWSKPFDTKQELRKGCVISPLLVNTFLAAVPVVFIQRFGENVDILVKPVLLQEQPWQVRPEFSVDCMLQAVWVMLCAEDTCIVSRSLRRPAKIMEVIVQVYSTFGFTASEENVKTMPMRAPCKP